MGVNVKVGTEYEEFVQSVYQAVLNADGVENISVQHNVQRQGLSGCLHQIDVYWEFRLAGETYRTAIECKNFNRSVTVGKIRDFWGVISDIPGLGGIFATKIGYQAGAKKFAAQKGVSLRIVRKPNDNDWDGRVRKLFINAHCINVAIIAFQPRYTQATLERLKALGIDEFKTDFSNYDPIIFSKDGQPQASYVQMQNALPHDRKSLKSERYFMPFPDHEFHASGYELEIDGCEFLYDVNVTTEQSVIDGDDFVHAVIKDVQSGDVVFVDKSNSPRDRPRVID